jgi:phenylacetate-CoA ligase
MNPFYNPAFIIKLTKSYLSDINRIWKFDQKQLKKYQDKEFRKIFRYSLKVPVYYNKYKKSNISQDDIKGIKDIDKIPIITKNDLRKNFPDKIITPNFNKKNSCLISSSGSTGKPLFIYCSVFSSIKRLEGFARILKAYGGNWKKSKTLLLIDLTPGSVEYATYIEGGTSFLNKIFSLNNIKYLPIKEKTETLIKKINDFEPEFLGSDPIMLKKLAYYKINEFGKNITPKLIFSSGSMLDQYTKKYIEKAFETKVLDVYGSTEGGPMAFECLKENHYHLNSDFIYFEFLDKNNQPVSNNKPGNIIITRLYGKDTPIIRYNGLEDIAIPIEGKCSSGIKSKMIKNIEGRITDLIILPNDDTVSPFTLSGIPAKIMEEYNTLQIKQFQIVQNKKSEIEFFIVIDENLRNTGITIKKLHDEIRNRIKNQIKHEIEVIIKEKKSLDPINSSEKFKVFISNINKTQ